MAPFNGASKGALTYSGRRRCPPRLHIPTGPEQNPVDPMAPGKVGPQRSSVTSCRETRGDACVTVEKILLLLFNCL